MIGLVEITFCFVVSWGDTEKFLEQIMVIKHRTTVLFTIHGIFLVINCTKQVNKMSNSHEESMNNMTN